MITSYERLRRAFFHEEMDRPAVTMLSLELMPKDSSYDKLTNYIENNWDLSRRGINSNNLETQYIVDTVTEKTPEGHERIIDTLHTPMGNLTATGVVNLIGQPALPETYFIKSIEDAKKYLSLPIPKPGGDITPYYINKKAMGNRGIVDVRIGENPAGFTSGLMGSELFALFSVTNRDIIYALCERRMTIILNRLKFVHEQKLGPFFSMGGEELVVPPLHGPKDFYDFNYKYDKPIIDLIHEGGGRIHIHCHGALKTVLHYFVEMGADVIHPIEGAPTDTMTVAEAKEIIRGKICMHGNIQLADFYEKTPDEIRARTLLLIKQGFDDRQGLMVAPTATPYSNGEGNNCFEQFKAMTETVWTWPK